MHVPKCTYMFGVNTLDLDAQRFRNRSTQLHGHF